MPDAGETMATDSTVKLSIAYDSEAEKGYETGWGFAVVIEADHHIMLFDCGWDGHLLRRNLGRLGYNMADIETVFLSHAHWDHIGGLTEVLQDASMGRDLTVVLHEGFSQNLRNEIGRKATTLNIAGPKEIVPGISSTGVLGSGVKEQALVVKAGSHCVVVTGCAHPGMRSILERASELGRIDVAVGGFHGASVSEFPRDLIQLVICHCTMMKSELLSSFGSRASIGKVGDRYEFGP